MTSESQAPHFVTKSPRHRGNIVRTDFVLRTAMAQKAFQEGDVASSLLAHTLEPGHQLPVGKLGKLAATSALDGSALALSLLFGLSAIGLGFAQAVVVILVSALCMALYRGASALWSRRAKMAFIRSERLRIAKLLETNPQATVADAVALYEKCGFSSMHANKIVSALSKQKGVFLDLLMIHALHSNPQDEEDDQLIVGATAACCFVFGAFMPVLMTMGLFRWVSAPLPLPPMWTCTGLYAFEVVVFGVVKTLAIGYRSWYAGAGSTAALVLGVSVLCSGVGMFASSLVSKRD